MINFASIGLFGTNRHFLNIAKEWWLKNADRFKGWNVFLNPAKDNLEFFNYKDHYRNFYVFLLRDDYACIQGRRFDIIVNPPEHLKEECHYRLSSSTHSFISYQYIFDILEFILERNNELDCLDCQSLKCNDIECSNVTVKNFNGVSFSKDSIPSYVTFTTDRPMEAGFVTISDPLKDGTKRVNDFVKSVNDSALNMGIEFKNALFGGNYKEFIKDLLNLKFGKGGIDMDIRNKIEDVIFNGPATIVKWTDGTKTIVKCKEGEINNPYMGLAMCISKKVLGNKGNFNDVFKKWITPDVINPYMTAPQEGK